MGIAGLWYITTMNGNFLFTVRDSILVGRRKALRWSLLKRSSKAGEGWRMFLDLQSLRLH